MQSLNSLWEMKSKSPESSDNESDISTEEEVQDLLNDLLTEQIDRYRDEKLKEICDSIKDEISNAVFDSMPERVDEVSKTLNQLKERMEESFDELEWRLSGLDEDESDADDEQVAKYNCTLALKDLVLDAELIGGEEVYDSLKGGVEDLLLLDFANYVKVQFEDLFNEHDLQDITDEWFEVPEPENDLPSIHIEIGSKVVNVLRALKNRKQERPDANSEDEESQTKRARFK